MGFILGLFLLFVIGGIVLRFSKRFKISAWQVVIYLFCWIAGGAVFTRIVKSSSDSGEKNMIGMIVYALVIIFMPWIIINGLKVLGRIIGWAIGGWSNIESKESDEKK